jgi:hypothetical protein
MKYISQKDIKKSIFVTIDNPKQPGTERKPTQEDVAKKKVLKKKSKIK